MAKLTRNERIFWIAKVFYRQKKWKIPRGFGPKHKMWVHFEKTLRTIERLELKGGLWRTYLKAQFEYAPDGDRERVWAQMLYGPSAEKKWAWYEEKRKRRVGTHHPKALAYVADMTSQRALARFEQASWDLVGLQEEGKFSTDEAFRLFHPFFPIHFMLASPAAAKHLTNDSGRYGPLVHAALERGFLQDPRIKRQARQLYDRCYEEAQQRWRKRLAV